MIFKVTGQMKNWQYISLWVTVKWICLGFLFPPSYKNALHSFKTSLRFYIFEMKYLGVGFLFCFKHELQNEGHFHLKKKEAILNGFVSTYVHS